MIQPVFQPEIRLEEIRKVSDFSKAFSWLYHTGIQRGELTGWASLDQFFSVRLREWTLVTGIPSHGKSALLDNLMVNLSYFHKWRWVVFSAENLPLERHAAKLAEIFIGKSFGPSIRERMSKEELETAEAFLDTSFRWLSPHEDDCTIDRVLELAAMVSEHESVQGIVIDPWNELDHTRPPAMTETEYISRVLTKVRRFAREHEVHIFLVAHPVKLQRLRVNDPSASEATVYPVPTPYDVAGSAHFRNKADNCLCVWRDVAASNNETDVHVQKVRFREIGRVGCCRLRFDPTTGRFHDLLGPQRGIFSIEEYRELHRLKREPGCDDQ